MSALCDRTWSQSGAHTTPHIRGPSQNNFINNPRAKISLKEEMSRNICDWQWTENVMGVKGFMRVEIVDRRNVCDPQVCE
ncbi:hypothetical protein J6590_072162 [Homalodisca vitripennis]|nr:hypothetical protein J6590_072162 [Homalodisca vitripennis]